MPTRAGLDAITARLDAGESLSAVAADLGLSERTIRNWMHRVGLPLASSRARDRRRSRLDDAVWLREQHIDRCRSASTIARRLGVSTAEVRAALDRSDIAHPPARPELTAEALRAAFAAGETVSSIARRVGIDRSGVRQRMRRYGIENPHADRGRRPALLDDPVWLRRRYVDDLCSMKAIGAEVGASGATVGRALRRHGIDRPAGIAKRIDLDRAWLGRCMRWIDCRSPRSPVVPVSASARSTGEGPSTASRFDHECSRRRNLPWQGLVATSVGQVGSIPTGCDAVTSTTG